MKLLHLGMGLAKIRDGDLDEGTRKEIWTARLTKKRQLPTCRVPRHACCGPNGMVRVDGWRPAISLEEIWFYDAVRPTRLEE